VFRLGVRHRVSLAGGERGAARNVCKTRVIQYIELLAAKLQSGVLPERRVFNQAKSTLLSPAAKTTLRPARAKREQCILRDRRGPGVDVTRKRVRGPNRSQFPTIQEVPAYLSRVRQTGYSSVRITTVGAIYEDGKLVLQQPLPLP
jgi:hypothetical protein